jgi:flagellin
LGITGTLDTATNAAAMLATLNSAINTISSRRSTLGSLQNRLESVIAHIDTVVENLSGAESRIRDADIAAETANMMRFQILANAGANVLNQANQAPLLALALLK